MIILDSSAIIEVLKGSPIGGEILDATKDEEIVNTSLTLQEVLLGAKDFEKTSSFFDSTIVLGLEKDDAIKSVEIEKNLTKKGIKINKTDIMIAAICINNGATLLSLDNDFTKIQGLKLKIFSSEK